MTFFLPENLGNQHIIFHFAQNINIDIKRIIDYLTELTGCEVKMLAHEGRNEDELPLAIASCYTLCDIELMETTVTIAVPT